MLSNIPTLLVEINGKFIKNIKALNNIAYLLIKFSLEGKKAKQKK